MSLQRLRRLLGAALIAAGLAAVAAVPASARRAHMISVRVQVTSATASGSTITITGRVVLEHATAPQRKHLSVLVILRHGAASSQRWTLKLGSRRTFHTGWKTREAGHLTLTARAWVAGKVYGKVVKRVVYIAPAVSTSPPPPSGGTPLVGTFKIAPGSAPTGQSPTGSYFEMLQPGGAPLPNLSSPAPNKNYTPLAPGTDGGLETGSYQPAPTPSFAGGSTGNALADRIIQPATFYLVNFSVETGPTDAQTGSSDPAPSVLDDGGQLSGQVTAWVAQWNGQSFNQGTPKPGGSVPPPTTYLTGTYDASSQQYTLDWKSLIVGGPFNGFTGVWHLTGTFVPQPSSATGTTSPILPIL